MSDYNDIIKQGYLKLRSKNLGLWQKKWVILRKASSKGATRLERYSDERASTITYEAKTTDLTYVERLERSSLGKQHHVITLWFVSGDFKQLAASSDMDATDWYDVLLANLGGNGAAVAPPPGPRAAPMATNIPRDMYHVYLLPNTNTEYSGEYLLLVTSEAIVLRDPFYTDQTLVTWRLNTLRRYGRDDSKFTFEAGRSSETGEGLFIFTSVDCERIYQKVHTATQALVTVKNITRRQLDSSLSVGPSPAASLSLTRHLSEPVDTSCPPPVTARRHDDLGPTKSLPVSPVRGPIPVPREAPGSGADLNANTEYLYAQAHENRAARFTEALADGYGTASGVSSSYSNGESDPITYIYEEKGLSPGFRQFLAERKQPDDEW